MSDSGNPFLLPGAPPARGSEVPVESGTRRVPRLEPGPDPRLGPDPEVDEATVLTPVAAGSPAHGSEPRRWRLVLPDGAEVPLDQPVLLGRDPSPPDGVHGARPIAVRDPQQTVSKTHALLRPVPGGIAVRDLHSTNGTMLVLAAGRSPVPADGEVVVSQPAQLLLGRFAARLEG